MRGEWGGARDEGGVGVVARARAGRGRRQRAETEEQRAGRVGRTRRPRDGRAQEDFRGRSRSRAVSRVFTLENVAVARYADVGAGASRSETSRSLEQSFDALSPDRRARRRKRSKRAFARGTNQSFEIGGARGDFTRAVRIFDERLAGTDSPLGRRRLEAARGSSPRFARG